MSQLLQDVGQSVRSLRKSPGFVAAAVIVMALGIGANTAIFSVVNAVLIRPLPYSDPSRLMFVWHVPPARSFPGITRFAVSPANYFDWKAMNSVFQDSAIFGYESFTRTGLDRPETIAGSKVEISFFRTLGVEPMLGRTFLPGEDQPGREHVVVLSHALWKERFASDPSIVGRTIQFDDEPYTVIGVMPGRVALPRFAQVWTPLAMTSQERQSAPITITW